MNKVSGMKWDEKFGNSVFSFNETKAFTDTGTALDVSREEAANHARTTVDPDAASERSLRQI